jgi:hypothetical protein
LACSGAQGALVLNITDKLTDATYGTAAGVVDGVVQEAANFWINNISKNPGYVQDLSGNATFKLIFKEGDVGGGPAGTSSVPAGTANPAALPALFSFTITVDNSADLIKSMFWDPTPGTTLDEFNATGTAGRYTAKAGGPADGKYDMFTVLEHEIGHVLAYNDYTDFENFVNNYWNKQAGKTKIALPADHFIGGTNLMSNAAALPGGKSGRVFAQPEDWLPTPEPGTWMVSLGLALIMLGLIRKNRLT